VPAAGCVWLAVGVQRDGLRESWLGGMEQTRFWVKTVRDLAGDLLVR
jgi:hypothetical protein